MPELETPETTLAAASEESEIGAEEANSFQVAPLDGNEVVEEPIPGETHGRSRRELVMLTIERIFFFTMLGLLAAMVVYLGYRGWQNWRLAANGPVRVSIDSINSESDASQEAPQVVEQSVVSKAESEQPKNSLVEPKNLSVLVLNGSGVVGAAGKVKDLVVAGGYAKAKADNAQASGYQGLTVYYLSEKQKEAESLLAVLRPKYPTVTVKAAVTTEEKSSEIVIMVGK
ncbi:LytR family transcriptional regulator [Patescibacteria group bacterium]|nr:MAG: LytR family transcriptional regulator [Patescibacteria group bacterium]